MVYRPNGFVFDQSRSPIKCIAICSAVPSTMCRRANGQDVRGRGTCAVGKPDNNTFPIVAMAKFSRRGILGEIPGIHQGIVAARSSGSHYESQNGSPLVNVSWAIQGILLKKLTVYLSCVLTAFTTRASCWVETLTTSQVSDKKRLESP